MKRIEPTLDSLVADLKTTIVLLLEAHRPLPALMVLYSGIDILGSLDSQDGVATRDTFIQWADSYMVAEGEHRYSSLDLYSARCGLLHTWSPATRLTKAGSAREVVYAIDRPRLLPVQPPSAPVVIHPPWLWLTFRNGASRFVDDVLASGQRIEQVNRNLAGTYLEQTL